MLELWGGHECTVNRVGDAFHDQTVRSGHEDRPADLDLFAALGLKALRYPVLWERVSPTSPDVQDWAWSDARLARLRDLGLRPIVGLLHHGSGPAYTALSDPAFPERFAAYAGAAARRYPWVEDWTPINEPLTTARFSAQYGLWYPHHRDEAALWGMLLNQLDAIRLAMAQIRAVRPDARLIQTEDLGRTYGRGPVHEQVEFENLRRWATWDLLTGRVTEQHPLWGHLASFGFTRRLAAIAEAPCPPDLVGVNHYLTSERFLDTRLEAYPAVRHGGNGHLAYADVEAIRVASPAPPGLEGVLREAWARYRIPLAITECHNGCTREEQVRWLRETWGTAERLRAEGVDLRAVTAWALLGSHDWCSLLTCQGGAYEAGAFDVRSGFPRPTALAAELRRLSRGEGTIHPGTLGPGWWRRDIRLEYAPVSPTAGADPARPRWRAPTPTGPPLLITGATGTLGRAFGRACEARGLAYELTDRQRLPLEDRANTDRVLAEVEPWAVVNAAGWVRVDDAEADPRGCHAANAVGPARLAEACAAKGVRLLTFSSDLVFDGAAGRAYLETDPPAPRNVYGMAKAAAEAAVLAADPRHLVVRTAAFFSPYDPHNFAMAVRRQLAAGRTLPAAADLIVSPTYVPDLVDAALDLLLDGEFGLHHLASAGACTWADFAIRIAQALGLDPALVAPRPARAFGWAAPRPEAVPLASIYGARLPSLEDAIGRFVASLDPPVRSRVARVA